MAEAGKAERYAAVRAEIAAVIAGEPNRIARYASAASLLAQAFPERCDCKRSRAAMTTGFTSRYSN